MPKINLKSFYFLGFTFWILTIFLALKFGAVSGLDFDLIRELRLPRVLLAAAVGIGLAVAGATLQALFSNPLCEPYTLGISSGAALGGVIGISLGFQIDFAGMTGSAFLGALGFTGILYALSFVSGNRNHTLLLGGVMLGFLGSSLVALWMTLADANGVQGAIAWLFGDLSRGRPLGSFLTLSAMLLLSFYVWTRWRDLDALLLGEEAASTLGIDVKKTRRNLILCTSLLVGLCVSSSGMIGFVGLVVPHFIRRWVGSLHFHLIPLSAIWGAAALTLADVASRLIASPRELPVGVVTALVGVPLFFWIVVRRRQWV